MVLFKFERVIYLYNMEKNWSIWTYFLSALFFILILGCAGDNEPKEMDPIEEKVTFCDCKELELDQMYNRFYYVDPSEGYTGTCETYFPNQDVKQRKHFKDGKIHGALETFYENGQLQDIKHFDMNLQSGDYKLYTEDGRLLLHAIFERGRHTDIIFKDPNYEKYATE